MFYKPLRLNPGDQVLVFIPSSPIKDDCRSRGINRLQDLGYKVAEVEQIMARDGFLAKQPQTGIRDLQDALDNKAYKALWAARGGYGSNHLLPYLKDLSFSTPKIIIGSSDVSYLLWFIMEKFKTVVFYGPMAYSSLPQDQVNTGNLTRILTGNYREERIMGSILKSGTCEGLITGGCLSSFVSLIGTPYLPPLDGRILLLEDVNERPYKLDRMFWQIYKSDLFRKIKGLLLGEFPGCFKDAGEKNYFFRFLKQYVGDIPVIYDLPVGHSYDIHTIPLGIRGIIDTDNFSGLIIREKGVQ